MRCRLRTLMIVLALGPPLLAGCYALISHPLPVPLTELIVFTAIAAVMTGTVVVGVVDN